MGRNSEEQEKFGECVAYYTLSYDKLKDAIKMAKVGSYSTLIMRCDISANHDPMSPNDINVKNYRSLYHLQQWANHIPYC